MRREKGESGMIGRFLGQAAFAVILVLLVTLPVLTYGCLMMREEPAPASAAPPAGEQAQPEGD
jgi:hypothetical protein